MIEMIEEAGAMLEGVRKLAPMTPREIVMLVIEIALPLLVMGYGLGRLLFCVLTPHPSRRGRIAAGWRRRSAR